MGGDGGCVANNRRYMRGAGLPASSSNSKIERETSSSSERERLLLGMTTCPLTGRSLWECSKNSGIVACPYGNMYCREAAIQALLNRRRPAEEQSLTVLGSHVRGIKDLHPVRLHFAKSSDDTNKKFRVPSCPITGIELNGSVSCLLIVSSNKERNDSDDALLSSNVVSERAIKEMGIEGLRNEYGPFKVEDMIRILPPTGPILDSIRQRWDEQCREEEKVKGLGKKKETKDERRKHIQDTDEARDHGVKRSRVGMESMTIDSVGRSRPEPVGPLNHVSAAHQAREYVTAAVASNTILSSLFTDTRNS